MKMNCMQKPNVDDSWIPSEGEIINMMDIEEIHLINLQTDQITSSPYSKIGIF